MSRMCPALLVPGEYAGFQAHDAVEQLYLTEANSIYSNLHDCELHCHAKTDIILSIKRSVSAQ